MIFTKNQMKVIYCKTVGKKFIKGVDNSGKSISAIARALVLKNKYSLYDEDRILYLNCNKNEEIKKEYNIEAMISNIQKENIFKNISIFSLMNKDIEFFNLKEFVYETYNKLRNLNNIENKKIIEDTDKDRVVQEILKNLSNEYKNIKFIRLADISFIEEEIYWIKNMGFTCKEEYFTCKRSGKNAKKYRLNKGSKAREIIYKILERYNEIIQQEGYIDYEDMIYFIINSQYKFYVHIIVDYCEQLSLLELKLVNSIVNKKNYSDEIYIMHNLSDIPYSCMMQGKRVTLKNLGKITRRFNFKEEIEVKKNKNIKQSKIDLMERFEFVDIKHRKEFEFMRDYANIDDIIVMNGGEEEEYAREELRDIPVYSNIAAGQPIMISSEQEGKFYLPKYWFKGQKECFILKVKGDSMINANINNGDYVVIRKQSIAENKDIVAVELDGSATLKRLYIDKQRVQLLPENNKYNPININEEDCISILGVALGVIKFK
ncbi:LexA family protein [Hathewaya limosa]|uniref:SOS regulatory protein LexA n=1 Tax=Hathewaya limosa TaxID=1536 RepID=A0ABU0JSE0_HATLI|nr:LexA family transcriptional regulator [Hathewaya limosa]MDQ0480018.1 SOS regulatory protein LexA [Hathewaya limosa]